MRKISVAGVALTLLLSACSGEPSPQIKTVQRKDKVLSCKEILLEMNEAEFYRSTAQKNKGPKITNVLMPLGYISTYMSAEEAMTAASARIDYLDRIYQIMECDGKQRPTRLNLTGGASHDSEDDETEGAASQPSMLDTSPVSDSKGAHFATPKKGEVNYRYLPSETARHQIW